MNMKRVLLVHVLLMGVAIFLSGCVHPARSPLPALTPIPPNESSSQNEAAPLMDGSPPLEVLSSTPPPAAAPPAIPDDSLRISFPTPAPAPVSHWRPALYPVPWALGPFDHFYFSRPISADKPNWPVPDYRYGGVFFRSDIVHTGVDIPSPKGTPVHAAGPGKVMWANYGLFRGKVDERDPYGLAVLIKHDFGYQGHDLYTVYAHLDSVAVIPGQRVETGDLIGAVGTTGLTTGPHLHFEVRINYSSFYATRNPELWLVPPEGWGVLVGRLMNTNGSLLTGQALNVRSLDTDQRWTVFAYGGQTIHPDDYYQENVVLSDLPAGTYELTVDYQEKPMVTEVTITPGAVTYFTFRGKYGFKVEKPPVKPPVAQ
jgi:murein DD-endopeptidase MepM/ murein hydrolase activator NlpD